MENETIWRLVLKINNDFAGKELVLDFLTLELAVQHWFIYTNEREEGRPKYTVCGPLPVANLTFSESKKCRADF